MRTRIVKLSLLTAAFVFIAGADVYAAPVTVTIDFNDPGIVAKLNAIKADPIAVNHVNTIMEKTRKENALAKPLELTVVDPILGGYMKTQVKGAVMEIIRGKLITGPPASVNPLGKLPPMFP